MMFLHLCIVESLRWVVKIDVNYVHSLRWHLPIQYEQLGTEETF